jgi:hypothetical protein
MVMVAPLVKKAVKRIPETRDQLAVARLRR